MKMENKTEEKKPSREELKARLREKMNGKKIHRMDKTCKEAYVQKQMKKMGLTDEQVEEARKLAKKMQPK